MDEVSIVVGAIYRNADRCDRRPIVRKAIGGKLPVELE